MQPSPCGFCVKLSFCQEEYFLSPSPNCLYYLEYITLHEGWQEFVQISCPPFGQFRNQTVFHWRCRGPEYFGGTTAIVQKIYRKCFIKKRTFSNSIKPLNKNLKVPVEADTIITKSWAICKELQFLMMKLQNG